MKILFKYTTRSRRSNFLRGYDSIIKNVTSKDYHVLISVENEITDPKMHPLPALEGNFSYRVNPDKPTTKIDAINRDVNEFLKLYDADIIVNMSDDMCFIQAGFDEVIRKSFEQWTDSGLVYADTIIENLDQCLHFPDGNRNDLITMSVLGRTYYNRFNYIYHPAYKSLYCDNEQTDVSKLLGCYKFVDKNILLHLHPAFGKGEFDAQYQHTESFSNEDSITYYNRKANGFT